MLCSVCRKHESTAKLIGDEDNEHYTHCDACFNEAMVARVSTQFVIDTDDHVREGMRARGMIDGVDYTIEDGRVVYSAAHLRKRGWCCNHRCRNCPWRDQI